MASLAAFGAPFLLPGLAAAIGGTANSAAAALFLTLIVALSLYAAWGFPAASGGAGPAKETALLGAIVAADAALRLVPSIGGVSAVFPLIIVAGAVFGSRFGFLTGTLSLMLSAVITGGIGPWLPYQMLGAGWVGAGAGLLAFTGDPGLSRWPNRAWLCLYGVAAGIGYGLLLSITSWPLAAPEVATAGSLYWSPDRGAFEQLMTYGKFYLATSLLHDLTRAAGNAALLLLFGPALFRLLHRASIRLSWTGGPTTKADIDPFAASADGQPPGN